MPKTNKKRWHNLHCTLTVLFLSILGKRPWSNWEILRCEICQFGNKCNRFKSNFGNIHSLNKEVFLMMPMGQLWKLTL